MLAYFLTNPQLLQLRSPSSLRVRMQQRARTNAPGARIACNGPPPLPFDAESARMYARLFAAARAAGQSSRARLADLLIASTAAANGLPLYSATLLISVP